MKLSSVKIHNFRSISEQEIKLSDYSLLVGENNAGKTNIITALRIFYEDGIKYDIKTDFPKFKSLDKESWIELRFKTTSHEQNTLKNEYRSIDSILKVRKYLQSENKDLVKFGQSNIYAYESGKLSSNLFYGAKNISNAKLGSVVFIPEISKTGDNLKMSGPSPLRNVINFVMRKVIKDSKNYSNLQKAFEKFNNKFREESSTEGFSLKELSLQINEDLSSWGVNFGLEINPITSDDILKNLVSHYLEDNDLEGERISVYCFGQGLQRNLIYTLLRISSKYVDTRVSQKKEFSPDLTLLLFEEPESFMHPVQQELLNDNLRSLSTDDNQQIICCSHSPVFVSRNIQNLDSLVKVQKIEGKTSIFQIDRSTLRNIIESNDELRRVFSDKLSDTSLVQEVKDEIKKRKLSLGSSSSSMKLEEESLKYFMWLDSERSRVFFSKHVFICEGATEKIFMDYLVRTEWRDLLYKKIYFLDAMGKFNIHRYMNLMEKLGIKHSVVIDSDKDKGIQKIVNDFLQSNRNAYTIGIYSFDTDIEGFLKIDKPRRADLKPVNIIQQYLNGNIDKTQINNLKVIVEKLL